MSYFTTSKASEWIHCMGGGLVTLVTCKLYMAQRTCTDTRKFNNRVGGMNVVRKQQEFWVDVKYITIMYT